MILRIIDCSNLIYAGYYGNRRKPTICRGVREKDGMWEDASIPVGGLNFALKFIYSLKDENTDIIPVFDKSPRIKNQMYSDTFGAASYKAGRGKSATPTQIRDIRFNKKWTEDVLNKCGFNCQSAEGYEADDIIYTLVEYYKSSYDHIYIHTKDSDLSFLVDDHVSIAKAGNVGKEITKANYYYTAKTGDNCLYNTIHLHKLYKGDTADNIPGIGYEWASRFTEMFDKEDMTKLGDLDFARKCLRVMVKKYPTENGASLVLPTFNILCPLLVPEELLNLYETEPDWHQLAGYWLNQCRTEVDNWDCESLVEEFIEEYYD